MASRVRRSDRSVPDKSPSLRRHSSPAGVFTGLSLVATLAILILHYATAPREANLHDLLRRLFYLPVITAGIAAGLRGGLFMAGVACAAYLPHVRQLSHAGQPALDHLLELVLLLSIGTLVGAFADASRRARARAVERARLAALGEVGITFIAQVEGPLAAIEGQVETLAFLTQRQGHTAIAFSVEAIQREASRARRFLQDLRNLAQRTERRVAPLDLSAMVAGVVADLGKRSRRAPPMGGLAVLVSASGGATIQASRAVVAYSLRALLQGLLSALPESGRLAVTVEASGDRVEVVLTADAGHAKLADLREALGRAFGPAADEYKFDQALCLQLLASEGAAIRISQPEDGIGVVSLRFQRLAGPGRQPGQPARPVTAGTFIP